MDLPSALAALEQALVTELERDQRATGIPRLLEDYCRKADDWRRFALFSPEEYTRNLVVRNRWFDLIVLCWGAGQESPIHSHAGQRCWMGVLEGEVEEIYFDEVAGSPPRPGRSKTFPTGGVAFINDDIALHVIRAAGGAPAISLHLYSLPYDECNVYCPETGKVSRKQLGFHSRGGELCG